MSTAGPARPQASAAPGALSVLSGHTFVYLLGSLAAKAAAFLLLPIFTPLLSRAEYGVLELTDAMLALLLQIVGLKLDTALTRHYFDHPAGPARSRVVATAFVAVAALSVTSGALLYACAGWLAGVLPGQPATDLPDALRAVAVILVAMLLSEVPIAVLKADRRSVAATLWQLARLLVELAAKITLVVAFAMGVMGVLLGQALAAVLFLFGFVAWLLRRHGLGFDRAIFASMVQYSAPMIVAGIAGFLLHSVDRFMMPYLSDFDQLGLYGIGYKFGAAGTSLVLGPFLFIWYPYIFALKDERERAVVVSNAALHTTTALLALSLPVALLAPEIIRAFTDPKFHSAWVYIPIILFAYLFWGLFQMIQTPFYVHKRTGDLPKVVGAAALVNVLLNLVLVPPYGALGASLATAVAFVFLALVARRAANRLEVVPLDVPRLLRLLVLCAVAALPLYLLPVTSPWSLGLRLLVLAAALAYLLFGILKAAERAHLVALLARLRPRRKRA